MDIPFLLNVILFYANNAFACISCQVDKDKDEDEDKDAWLLASVFLIILNILFVFFSSIFTF